MKHQQERLKLFSLDVENVGGLERALCTLCRREEPGWAVVKQAMCAICGRGPSASLVKS